MHVFAPAAAAAYSLQDAFALERRIEIGKRALLKILCWTKFSAKRYIFAYVLLGRKESPASRVFENQRIEERTFDVKCVFWLNKHWWFLKYINMAILCLLH